ncbi:MAG: FliG C-terminal domain-containing protein [Planctomycetota bacterium]|nr:FliG C-terminal domain-containing protein [Planctomycetota bacterium]
MTQLNRNERLALLITLLGDEARALAAQSLEGEALQQLEQALSDFDEFPPTKDEIDLVVGDFEESFQLAMASANINLLDEDTGPKLYKAPEETYDAGEIEAGPKFAKLELSGNIIADLNRLHPYQLAAALRNEEPAVIALVMKKLGRKHAASTIECLPETQRAGVILQLPKPMKTRARAEDLVLHTILDQALLVEERGPEETSSEQLAELLRSFPKPVRTSLFQALQKDDPHLAELVKKRLFRLDDMLRLPDRDLQLLLGQCSSQTLVVALFGCEEELLNKIFSNMSRRAKETLQEEMALQSALRDDEVQAARDQIVKVIAESDEAGKISIE